MSDKVPFVLKRLDKVQHSAQLLRILGAHMTLGEYPKPLEFGARVHASGYNSAIAHGDIENMPNGVLHCGFKKRPVDDHPANEALLLQRDSMCNVVIYPF